MDGYIARRWNLQTVVGTVIDPMADKTLMTILTVCLAIKGALPGDRIFIRIRFSLILTYFYSLAGCYNFRS